MFQYIGTFNVRSMLSHEARASFVKTHLETLMVSFYVLQILFQSSPFPVLSFSGPLLFRSSPLFNLIVMYLQHVIQIITIRIIKNKYKYQLSC